LAVVGSITDEAHVQDVVAQTLRTFGKLHILVNNAGIGDFGKRLHEIDDATWAKVLDINLTGVFRMTRAVLPELLKGGGGSIINISTVASLVGIRGLSAYAASKGGLDSLTRSIAVDYAQDNIRCNVMNPGLVDTPMAAPLMADPASLEPIMAQYAIRRPGKPEEVAKMALYLASDEATWVTGATFPIDGGMTISKG
jgi:NAD(P)-dependent dehydrogenase (short-subunit alcohol dehydrogenase family)